MVPAWLLQMQAKILVSLGTLVISMNQKKASPSCTMPSYSPARCLQESVLECHQDR